MDKYKETQKENYLTIDEVSAYLSLKPKTLYALVESGEIPHYRISDLIRFKKDEIEAWMEGNRVGEKAVMNAYTSSTKKADRPRLGPITDIDPEGIRNNGRMQKNPGGPLAVNPAVQTMSNKDNCMRTTLPETGYIRICQILGAPNDHPRSRQLFQSQRAPGGLA